MSILQKNTLIVSGLLAYGVLWFNFPEIAIALALAAGSIGYSCFCISGSSSEDYALGQPGEQELNRD